MSRFFPVFFSFYLAVSLFPGLAQELPEILITPKYRAGVYKTIQEFLNNEPSITEKFRMVSPSNMRRIEDGTADYELVFQDSLFKREERRSFWGACDGESIYVNELMYGQPFMFKKLHGLGRYCYLKGSAPSNYLPVLADGTLGGLLVGALVGAAIATPQHMVYILNVNNGKFYPLDKPLLDVILKQDDELFMQYEAENKPRYEETMISYVRKYNLRHADEALRDAFAPKTVILYRRNKREIPGPLTVRVDDSVNIDITRDSFYELEVLADTLGLCINQHCKKIALLKRKPNYVHCLWRMNADTPEITSVDREVGEYYVNQMGRNPSGRK